MSDITLDEIRSGYNLSRINDNFEKLEETINNGLLHTEGGNNTMKQQVDMNSNRITNLPAPVADRDPLRKGDISQDNSGASIQYVDDTVDAATTRFTFNNVSSLTSANYLTDYEGAKVFWLGYYETSDGGSNWGVVKKGSHSEDGGSIFSIDANTYIEANLKGNRTSILKLGAYSDGVTSSHVAIQLALELSGGAYFPRLASGQKYVTSEPIYMDAQKAMFGEKGALILLEKTTNNLGTGSNTAASGAVDSYDKDAVVIFRHVDGGYTTYADITNMHLKAGANNDYVIYAPRAFVNNLNNVILDMGDGLVGYYTNDTFMARFEDVQVVGDYNDVVGSIGFHWDDEGTGGSGTSCVFTRCWIRDGVETAIKARGLVYSVFNGCGTDRWIKHAVDLDLCDITFNGFGFENRVQVGTSPFKLRYSRVNINSAVGFSVNIADGSYVFDAQGGVTNVNGIRHTTTAAGVGSGAPYRVADGAIFNVSGAALSTSLSTLNPTIEGTSFFFDIDKGARQSFNVKNVSNTLVGELKNIFTSSLLLQSQGGLYLGAGGTNTLFTDATQFRPSESDGAINLGTASNRFNTVYAATGSINTSDENEKTSISGIPDNVLDAWESVPIVRWKFTSAVKEKGEAARWHVGRLAQDIERAFKDVGEDAFEWGVLCYDSWDEVALEDGSIVPAGDRYGIRENEASNLDVAVLRRKLGDLV